ncbi:hypothetical protein [Mycobacterium seoulense]|uniref:Uncharacterized protein n=1 Tax=Mycobacterium seoulense TaxID=386911 RepID=A0A7I7P171_9MYCO|nr:hypothetical protein [Mycobacterium seoulense]MCV7436528.1 hypothetical protein [Mycobacterium seoulense]BBY01508.1 hypothetical protein MSEO_20070 [Mycobacterium seoulense]
MGPTLSNNQWDEYLKWNTAVADVIYPFGNEAAAYMDLEANELADIAERAGQPGPDPDKALAEAVRAVVVDCDDKLHLHPLEFRTSAWKRCTDIELPPPCLAFLAVSALAAEDMGQSGDKLAAHAYYPRLARRLGVPEGDKSVETQYRKHAEFFWQCLNTWLVNQDGNRGLPTAYALTHRYVGLPMSQALIREGDRRKFPEMFAQYGLSPGMQIAPDALTRYLDDWLKPGSSAPGNLVKLWQRPTSHERIASIAAVELSNWDGVLPHGSTDQVQAAALTARAGLVVNLRSGFRGSSLEIALGLRLPADTDGRMQVLSSDQSWLQINLAPGTAGLWRTSYTEAIDAVSMLEGVVRIRRADDEAGPEYKHFPKQIIPLTYDELQSAFVETERLQLGVDSLLLVRTHAQKQAKINIPERVRSALEQAARPGFEIVETLQGLPDGWVLFKNVQLFSTPSTDINELLPLAQNQLTIAGGLRIPSRIRKWSTLAPPEVRAIAQTESHVRVTITRADSDDVIHEWISGEGAMVAPLDELNLTDADYRLSLFVGTGKDPVQQSSIRLRSSRNVDVLWHDAPRLVYPLTNGMGVVSASERGGEDYACVVDGLVTSGDESGVVPSVHAAGSVSWREPRQSVARVPIQIGTPDPGSCVVTGAHYLEYPPFLGGWQPKYIQGTCRYCGLVKRSPGWISNSGSRSAGQRSSTISTVEVRDLPKADENEADWDAALDALRHLGGGPIASLNQIALQLEGTALFAENFRRTLEMLGHIAVERDNRWRPTRWEVSPPCLAETTDGEYRFTGFWAPDDIESIVDEAAGYGGQFAQHPSADAPTEYGVTGVSQDDAADLVDEDSDVTVVDDAGMRMLRALPRLSEVAAALARAGMPGFDSAERFDVSSASWVPTGDPYAAGAYRLRRGFETAYVFRSAADVEYSTAALAPPSLVKHLAANMIGTSLVSYQSDTQRALVPLGADLPGLYGRAIVAMSGALPQPKQLSFNKNRRTSLVYTDIGRDAADLLVTLFTT